MVGFVVVVVLVKETAQTYQVIIIDRRNLVTLSFYLDKNKSCSISDFYQGFAGLSGILLFLDFPLFRL